MVDFLKDPNKFQITVSCSAFDLLKHMQSSQQGAKDISISQTKTKDESFC